ncbi:MULTISPECIES: transcription termination/antitermination NusG family protein [unclassified Bradyrhizobium]
MGEQYWAACQMVSGMERKVRTEIEKLERGTFLPAFMRTRITRGRKSDHALAAVPGYVFFRTDSKGWSQIRHIEGVQRVLVSDEKAIPVANDEMMRMVLQDFCGELNDAVISAPIATKSRRRSRKPRPSKRARMVQKEAA